MRVPQRGGECQGMVGDVVRGPLAAFQRPHRQAVTQIVSPRLGDVRVLSQLAGPDQRAKRPIEHGITAWPAGVREKDMVIIARPGMALLQRAFQDTDGTGMQGYQPALAELGLLHQQTVRGSVLQSPAHRLGDTQPGDRQEPEECRVSTGSPCPPGAEARSCREELAQLGRREERGERPAPPAGEYVPGDKIMPGIFGPRVAGKHTHSGETVFPLVGRWCVGGPSDRRLPAHLGLGAFSSRAGKVAQQAFLHRQLDACCPAQGEILVDVPTSHGSAPSSMGHGC